MLTNEQLARRYSRNSSSVTPTSQTLTNQSTAEHAKAPTFSGVGLVRASERQFPATGGSAITRNKYQFFSDSEGGRGTIYSDELTYGAS